VANDLSAFNSEAWSSRLVTKLDQINVALPLVNRNWEGDLRLNKTVWVRTPGNITMAPYSRGTVISYEDLTPTKESFTVNDGEYFAFEVDDIDKAQSDLSAMDVYMKRAVVAMNNEVEAKILAGLQAGVPAGANRITGASSAAITLDSSTSTSTGIYPLFCKARAQLSKQNVPATPGARWAVIDPDTTSLLLQDTDHFVRAGELGDKVVQYGLIGGEEVARTAMEAPGFIGMLAGFMVYETPHVPVISGSKYLLFGDKEGLSYAAQITEIEALRLQTTFANAVRGLLLHDTFVPAEGAKRLVYIKAVA
jgi:P22 coat protein - gene protein 5